MNKIYRSQRDKKLFGLCGGIAEAINVDPTILRLVAVITAVFSSGAVILLYLIASMVIPKEPTFDSAVNYGQQQPYQPQQKQSYPQQPYQQQANHSYSQGTTSENNRTQEPAKANIDEMMKDIEKKAMQKEIEQLRAKVAKYEKEEE